MFPLSLFYHPFITYISILSTALAIMVWAVLQVMSVHRRDPFILLLPLAIPVVSYFSNYVVLMKACSFDGVRFISLRGLPSYHFFCHINHHIMPFIGPLSLAWLVFSLAFYAARWYQAARLLNISSRFTGDDRRARSILSSLCSELRIPCPHLRVFSDPRPTLLTVGNKHSSVLVSVGALEILDDAELRAAFAHELAHISRKGLALNWAFALLHDLTMFSPASLWAYASFRQQEEMACDDLALRWTGLGVDLASALVKFMKGSPDYTPAHSLGFFGLGRSSGMNRVARLLDASTHTHPLSPSWALVLGLILIVLLLFVC